MRAIGTRADVAPVYRCLADAVRETATAVRAMLQAAQVTHRRRNADVIAALQAY
jgi:hypothetical protein